MEDNRVKHETNQPQGQHLQAPAEQQMANRNIIVLPMGAESELETLIFIFGIILHIEAWSAISDPYLNLQPEITENPCLRSESIVIM